MNDRSFTSTRIVYLGNGSLWVFTMTRIFSFSFVEDENPSSNKSDASFVWISIYFPSSCHFFFFVLIFVWIPTLPLVMMTKWRKRDKNNDFDDAEKDEIRRKDRRKIFEWYEKNYIFLIFFNLSFIRVGRPFVSISFLPSTQIYNDNNNTSEKQHKTWWNFILLSFSTLLASIIKMWEESFLSYFSVSHYWFSTRYTTLSSPKDCTYSPTHKKAILRSLNRVPAPGRNFVFLLFYFPTCALVTSKACVPHIDRYYLSHLISSASISIFMYVFLFKNLK